MRGGAGERVHVWAKWLMVASIAPFVLGGVFAARSAAFVRRAVPATATIAELRERSGSEGGTVYAPVFVFTDAEGQSHTVTSSTASYPPVGEVGDTIGVLYDPENPKHAEVDRFFSIWLAAFVGGILGVTCLIVGAVGARITRPRHAVRVADPTRDGHDGLT